MNNNYHTQVNHSNNLLNEIAANNQLLQQGPSMAQLLQQIAQQQAQQQLAQAYAQQLQQQQNRPAKVESDEIDLSDGKPNAQTTQSAPIAPIAPITSNHNVAPITSNHNVTPITSNHNVTTPDNDTTQEVLRNLAKEVQQAHGTYKPSPLVAQPTKPPINTVRPIAKKTGSTNILSDYLLVPVILLIIFIVFFYPKTAKIFDKYLPALTTLKGIVIRGSILVVCYILIKLIVNLLKN